MQLEPDLVVQVARGRRVVELAGKANRFLSRVGTLEPRRHVPVQVVDGVRILGIWLGHFAGEDLRFLFEPGRTEGLDLRAAEGRCGDAGRNALSWGAGNGFLVSVSCFVRFLRFIRVRD